MKFQFDQDYHIHSSLSSCSSDPEQSTERILRYAKENGLKRIVVTDHYWDESIYCSSDWYRPQNFSHITENLPLPVADGVEFLFGCETELNMDLTLGIPRDKFDFFDFIIIPTTHFHIVGFVVKEEDKWDSKRFAELWVERLDALFSMDLPFHKIGIAHLICEMMGSDVHNNYLEPLKYLKDEDMHRIFKRAAELGVGIELNQYDLDVPDCAFERVIHVFRIAKEEGCKFYFGSDTHHPEHFERAGVTIARAVDALGLTEEDKFVIGGKE